MTASGEVNIVPVGSRAERREFVGLPYRLHRRHSAWVAPLRSEVRVTLDPARNPFFEHAEMAAFLAVRSGRVVGRIAAIVDRNYLAVRGEPVGLFGFFDCEDDSHAAGALFDVAGGWLRGRGMQVMLGPANPSMNDELGVLVDAFDQPPAVKMIWNPEYYPRLYEGAGFVKAMDLFAWELTAERVSERLMRAGAAVEKRTRAVFRSVDLKRFDREVRIFREVYNQAWSQNWGFVPWTEAEFDHVAKGLKQVVDPDLVFVAEVDGRAVGFILALPDLNLALRHIHGRLFPFGLPVLLWHARKIRRCRVVILGVLKEYRHRGIDTALYYRFVQSALRKGYTSAEMSWILENNEPMNRQLEMMGARRYKTYRLYQRPV